MIIITISIVSALEYRSGAILRTITQWRIQFESLALEYDLRANICPPARYYPSSCPFRIVVGASTTSHRRRRCRQILSFFAFNTRWKLRTAAVSPSKFVFQDTQPTYPPAEGMLVAEAWRRRRWATWPPAINQSVERL